MPIQRLSPPTLSEIEQTLREYEREFGVSTEEFVSKDEVYNSIPEDVAADWAYTVEQQRALMKVQNAREYWKGASGPQQKDPCKDTERTTPQEMMDLAA